MGSVLPFFASSYKEKYAKELKANFFERVTILTIRDLKDNDNKILELIRESLPIFEELLGKDAYMLCESAELEVTFSVLKCPFLERKIKALNEFKDFFERVDPQSELKYNFVQGNRSKVFFV